MATQATYDDANLILRLYELRRDEKLRKAREWFGTHFVAASMDDITRIAPPGSQENAYVRMVIGYWDMAASLVTCGVLNQELFFQSNGELLFVWERIRPVLDEYRGFTRNPAAWRNLQTVGEEFARFLQAAGPEAYPMFQQMVRGVADSSRAAQPNRA